MRICGPGSGKLGGIMRGSDAQHIRSIAEPAGRAVDTVRTPRTRLRCAVRQDQAQAFAAANAAQHFEPLPPRHAAQMIVAEDERGAFRQARKGLLQT